MQYLSSFCHLAVITYGDIIIESKEVIHGGDNIVGGG